MEFIKAPNRKGDKLHYYYNFGREKGMRPATGVFTYTNPKDEIQKSHNKEALLILETKKSQMILDIQATGGAYIPSHKFKTNFLDYYKEYVRENKKEGNRHLECSLNHFRAFVAKAYIMPTEITENFCKRFRQYLLDRLTGETPQNYFARFKWVIEAATKDKYFHANPVEKVSAIFNPSVALKENLESYEYAALLQTPCKNEEVGAAFIFSLYTALRWVDVKQLKWSDIKENTLVTRIIQRKTNKPVVITLHPIALKILNRQRKKYASGDNRTEYVFQLPTLNGANKILGEWVRSAGIDKHITWSCARLSFSILLQDERVDEATVAYLLGHTTTTHVRKTYKRHRPKPQTEAISLLPSEGGSTTPPVPDNKTDHYTYTSQPVNYSYSYTRTSSN